MRRRIGLCERQVNVVDKDRIPDKVFIPSFSLRRSAFEVRFPVLHTDNPIKPKFADFCRCPADHAVTSDKEVFDHAGFVW